MYIKNFFKHLHLINKHKWYVFKLCIKAGIPYRGLVHDLSKYSPTEFFTSVKYFNGTHSPIVEEKKDNGFSKAWLHHKGRNKHHYEYWIDLNAPDKTPIMPYKYTVEMICDTLAAGMAYKKKSWYPGYQLEYFNERKDKVYMNEKIKKLLERVYTDVKDNGIDKVVNKKNLKKLYDEYIK